MIRIVQFGDLASRLARALDLQGRGDLKVEDSILPVVIVSDATQLPFALEPRSGAGYGDVTGAVGQQATIAVQLNGSGAFWLKQIIVTRPVAGNIELNRSGRLEAGGVFTDKAMLDVSSRSAPNQGSLTLPLLIRQYTTPPAVIGSGIAISFNLPANTPFTWPVDVLIRTGETIYMKNTDTASRIIAGFQGLYYPTAAAE